MLAELREQQKTLSDLPGWRGAGLTANADAPVFGSAAAQAAAAAVADAESPDTGPGKDSAAHG
jgi:hypothetical protein